MYKIRIWLISRYQTFVSSIAFIPGLISLGFLILAVLVITFDFSGAGLQLKSDIPWLSIQDPSTARSILGAIAGGIISLTVFSFSMVMIVLSQAASQMSNRVLDKLIGNRFQQIVLGIYIGTIIYTFFLFITIREQEESFQIPSLSIFLLTIITVLDVFIFIYFLHYITQSVKYNVIIDRIKKSTFDGMKNFCGAKIEVEQQPHFAGLSLIRASCSGVFEGFVDNEMKGFLSENKCSMLASFPMGTYILRGQPILKCSRHLDDSQMEQAVLGIIISDQESMVRNYEYGFRQLSEIALKALSPGINDPGTAIISFRAMIDLFGFRALHFPPSTLSVEETSFVIHRSELSFDELFEKAVYPIWDYGKEDRMIRHEFKLLLEQLLLVTASTPVKTLLLDVDKKLEEK
ncbi:putative membrane protein [Algoriphagus ratkowskyi]|uniref:DUF2254 domain-containing protein n=1 Tax=Algoriphagus ratkowskyi TaxID=57028 RepID=A0A2W7R9X7_9BACT|nr:DUF2254 domain-containing protein [Algoriphagus ratkowskyi]PZX52477.1 putative membrane protein [Algoriphagus ratkowskyi]TXD76180.1 DUF2254 domain-containing protein [Algoriphagus ratkowskyi]